ERAEPENPKNEKRLHAWATFGYNHKLPLIWYEMNNSNGKMSPQVYIDKILDPVIRPVLEEGQKLIMQNAFKVVKMKGHLDTVTEGWEDQEHQVSDSKPDGAAPSVSATTKLSEASTALPAASTSFRDSRILIAVDVSGSTYKAALDAEITAIRNICKLVPRNLQPAIRILPWSDEAEEPKLLNQLDTLVSSGGTDPNVVIQHPECRYALQESSFWFLMTDGIIGSKDVQRFARGLLEYGLHGTACVISIFGDLWHKPSDCNITVGLSVFAVSPHTAFLYTDVESGRTFVLQTKGCFSTLLPRGRTNPTLDYSTHWDDLPQVSYENLSRISVPSPQAVSRDEIILNDRSKLNVTSLLQNLPEDDKIVSQILDNEDNLKSIALTAKVKGQSDRMQKWLDRIDHKIDSIGTDTVQPSPQEQRSQLLDDTISQLEKPKTPKHSVSAKEWSGQINNDYEIHHEQKMRRRRKSSDHARRISDSSFDVAGDNISSYIVERRRAPPAPPSTSLANHGFEKPVSDKGFFKGRCYLCASEKSVTAFLLRTPPEGTDTLHFPSPGSRSRLIYPLAVGNYPETDIVSSRIACDPCSLRLVESSISSDVEGLVAALPIVSFIGNKEPWLETVQVATQKRFHSSDLPIVFLSILYTKLERLLEQDASPQVEDLREALKWTCNMILSEVLISRQDSPDLHHFGLGALHEVLLRNFKDALVNVSKTTLLKYPLDGFIVANFALSNSKHKSKLSGSKRKRIVFLRFLYYLTDTYHEYAANNDDLVVQAAKALVLLLSDPIGPRSLIRWDAIRKLSLFVNQSDMRQCFSQINKKTQPFRLAISIKELTETPFFSMSTMNSFQRLGVLFNWISSHASHATAAFLHHLFRSDIASTSVQEHFEQMIEMPDLKVALAEPENLSAQAVEDIIKGLPPIHASD
ncbi:MAG: hypothetical protein Q9176_008089, partial [Flavoplaca citrina]